MLRIPLAPLAFSLSDSPESEFQGRVKSLGNWKSVVSNGLNWLNDVGFARTIDRALENKAGEIDDIFSWSNTRGVLIEVPVQVPRVPPEGPSPRELIGSSAWIVGGGSGPVGALAVHEQQVAAHGSVEPSPKDGWLKSTTYSRYFWITKGEHSYNFERYDYDSVMRSASALYNNAELLAKLSNYEDRNLLLNMAAQAAQRVKEKSERDRISGLRDQAAAALDKVDTINTKLKIELEQQAKLNALAATISAAAGVLLPAAQIIMAKAALGNSTPVGVLNAKSQAEFNNAITTAQQDGNNAIKADQATELTLYKNYIGFRQTIIIELEKQGAPTYILPRPKP